MAISGSREPKFFFKIILPPILEDKKLRIPLKFAKEYRNDISSLATLVVPGDKRWTIKVLSAGGELWFSDGLDKFFEFYSVSFGFFLLFEYLWDSEFRVRIFNLTACEISYPSINVSHKLSLPSAVKKEQVSNTVNVKKEVESTSNHDNGDDYEFVCKYGSDCDDDELVVLERPKYSRRVNVVVLSSDDEDQSCTMNKKPRLKIRADKNRNLSTHKPGNPFFRTTMKSYNVESDPMSLNIPADIGRKFPKDMSGLVKLEIADGRSWTVQGNFLGGRLRSLGNGWAEFVRTMKLRVDDVCIFELITIDKEFSMKVSMSRNRPLTKQSF